MVLASLFLPGLAAAASRRRRCCYRRFCAKRQEGGGRGRICTGGGSAGSHTVRVHTRTVRGSTGNDEPLCGEAKGGGTV